MSQTVCDRARGRDTGRVTVVRKAGNGRAVIEREEATRDRT